MLQRCLLDRISLHVFMLFCLSLRLFATLPQAQGDFAPSSGLPVGFASEAVSALHLPPVLAEVAERTLLVSTASSSAPLLAALTRTTGQVGVLPPPESNSPPVLLSLVTNQTINIGQRFTTTLGTIEPDFPAQALSFQLLQAPSNTLTRVLRGTNFLIAWTPSRESAGSTNRFVVKVSDSGQPSLSSTQRFQVVVTEFAQVAIGTTVVLAGQDSCIGIAQTANEPVTNLQFTVTFPAGTLTNLSIQPLAPQICSSNLTFLSPTQVLVRLSTCPGQPLDVSSGRDVADLCFTALENQPTRAAPILIGNSVIQTASGRTLTNRSTQVGRVVISGEGGMLEASLTSDLKPQLILYGRAGRTYQIEGTTNVHDGASWRDVCRVPMTGPALLVCCANLTDARGFFRAYEFSIGPTNEAPSIDVKPELVVRGPEVLLVARVTDDGLPAACQPLSYAWSRLNGPGIAQIESPTSSVTRVTLSQKGAHLFRLSVGDSQDTNSATVRVIYHDIPTVDAGPDQFIPLGNLAFLAGSAADDGLPLNTLTSWWTQVAGPASASLVELTNARARASFSVAGDYVFRFSAFDGDATVSDDLQVSVGDCAFANNGREWHRLLTGHWPGAGPGGSVVFGAGGACSAVLGEGRSFLTGIERTFTLPLGAESLRVRYEDLEFDRSARSGMGDSFEVALVDVVGRTVMPSLQGRDISIVQSAGSVSPLPPLLDGSYHWTEGLPPAWAPGVGLVPASSAASAGVISVDVRHLVPGVPYSLILRWVNNDQDTGSQVRITEVSVGDIDPALDLRGSPPPAFSTLLAESDPRPCGAESFSFSGFEPPSSQSVQGVRRPGDVGVLALTLLSPARERLVPAGPVLLEAELVALDPASGVRASITVNGQPVDYVDERGQVLMSWQALPGRNVLEWVVVAPGYSSVTNVQVFVGSACASGVATLEDITSRVSVHFRRTTFNPSSQRFYAEVVLSNASSSTLQGPVFLGSRAPSAPNVRLVAEDGLSEDGIPYYDLSATLPPAGLPPGGVSTARTLAFFNPDRVPFQFAWTLLGRLNRAPEFRSAPVAEARIGRPYEYPFQIVDPDGDAVSPRLVMGPTGLGLDGPRSAVRWTPSASDAGVHQVRIQANDGRGGVAEQGYLLRVEGVSSNRPPHFVSDPAVTNALGQTYRYVARAEDLDLDTLRYELKTGPVGMTVGSATGELRWNGGLTTGSQPVVLEVSDGRGGSAEQRFVVRVIGDANNRPPVITSQPFPFFEFAGGGLISEGLVTPVVLDLPLRDGESFEGTVSLQLPATNVLAGSADIAFVVDQSGSMAGEQAWIGDMIGELDRALTSRGIGPNRYALVGFSHPGGQEYSHIFPIAGGPWTVSIYGPDQVLLSARTFAGASNPLQVPLPVDGSYRVVVSGGTDPNPISYQMLVRRDTNGPASLTLGTEVQGAIETPGEQKEYRFAVVGNQLVYLDSMNPSLGLRWNLIGPAGQIVRDRSFAQSDSTDQDAAVLNLIPGSYRLVVSGIGAALGSFRFRVLDLAATAALTSGETVNGQLTPPNRTEAYRFSVNEGESLYVDTLTMTSGNAPGRLRLISPAGLAIGEGTLGSDLEVAAAPVTGNYALLVEGRINETNSRSFQLRVAKPISSSRPLVIGQAVQDTLSVPGEQQVHRFTLAQRALLYLDSWINTNRVVWTLSGPSGVVVDARRMDQSDAGDIANPVMDLVAGAYELRIDGVGDFTGAYAFRLLNLADAATAGLDTPLSVTLERGFETQMLGFDGVAGQRWIFDSLSRSNLSSARWRLVGPYGGVFFGTGIQLDGGVVGSYQTGRYVVLVEGSRLDVPGGTFSFRVISTNAVPVPSRDGAPLVLGQPVEGNLVATNQVDAYRFTLTNRALAYFDALTHRGTLVWSLAGPAGTNVAARRFDQSDSADQNAPVLDLVAGDYQLTVDATGTNVGQYRFQFSGMDQGLSVTPDADLSGTLDPANRTALYQFQASAGQRAYVDQRGLSGGTTTARWRLVDPLGRIVRNELLSADLESGPLAMSGTYGLLLEGRGTETNSRAFSFRLHLHSTNELALALDQEIRANLTRAGERHTYVFRLAQREFLYFDSLTNQSTLTWTLVGPPGNVINGQRFDRSDSFDNSDPVFSGFPGTYRLTVSAAGDVVGGYGFALRRPGVAPVLTPNTPILGNLNPPNVTRLYRVNVAVGDRFYADMISLTGGATSSRWRWFDTAGSPLVTANLDADFTWGPAEHAGTYLLAVEGRVSEPATRDFSLQLNRSEQSAQPLTSGLLVESEIVDRGEQDTYTITLPQPSLVYVDSLSNTSLHWTLDGPGGVVVNARRFDATDSSGIAGNPVLDLPAGDYRFTVAGATGQVGAYAFRWIPLSSADPLEVGTDVTGQLNPANSTRLYRFTAAPGERIYLEMRSISGPNTGRWRLMDPWGGVAASASFGVDLETTALALGGIYTVLLEGAPGDVATRDFVFRLDLSRALQSGLVIGQRIQGNLARAGEEAVYEFALATRSLLYLDALSHTNTLVWSLNGPGGLIVDRLRFDRTDSGDNSNPILDLPTGRYRMTVDGVGEATAGFAFRWLNLADGSPITKDTVVAADLDPPNQTRVFRLDAAAGDRVIVDALARTNLASARMRLVNPYGLIGFNVALGTDVPNVVLGQSGAYSLLVEGSRLDTVAGSTHFKVVSTNSVVIPPLVGSPITLGQPVEGTLVATNQVDSYRFNLVSRSLLYFDSRTPRSGLVWGLRGPSGSNVINRRFDQSDSADLAPNPVLDLPAGEYEVSVDGVGTNVGAYRFALSRLEDAVELEPGVSTDLNLDPPGQTQLYRFKVSGERLYLNGRGLSGGTTTSRWRLVNGLGQVIGDAVLGNDLELPPLPFAGPHYLLVEGRISETVARTLSFTLELTSDTEQSLNLGESITGSIGSFGERDVYKFQLTSRTLLYFDAITPLASVTWSLEGPAGVEVTARPFSAVDPSSPLSLLDLVPGEYRLSVDGVADALASYQFRLLEPSRLNLASGAVSQTGALDSGRAADVFWIEGRAGDQLVFDYGEAGNYFGSAALFAGATRLLSTSGSGVEDGYHGVDKALAELPFRVTAAANLVLVTDEDRDVVNPSLTLSNLLQAAVNHRVRINTILDGPVRDDTGTAGIGLDVQGNAYLPDGLGGFQVGTNGTFAGAVALQQQYLPLAFETGGATWDLNLLRQGGSNALSFTRAFVEVNVEGIERQLRLELIASDPSAIFTNRTGIVSGIGSGDTARFTYRLTRAGDARAFELQFVRPGTTNVIGSIPVRLRLDYAYPIRAVDPDGDPVRFSVVDGPAGAVVDPVTGLLRWRGTSADPATFTVRVEDGRGGSTLQTFTVHPAGTNRPPVFEGTIPSLAAVNRLFTTVLPTTDPDSDPLRFEVTNAPPGMVLNPQTGLLEWRPTETQLGRFDLQFRVLDGRGGVAVLSHRIEVRSALENASPVFVSTPAQRALAGRAYVYPSRVTDVNADAIRFDLSLAPPGMSVDAEGVVSWVPSLSQLGSHVVVLRAQDDFGGAVAQSYTLEVTAENSSPVIASRPKLQAIANRSYRYELRAQDAEDSSVIFRLSAPTAAGLTLSTSSFSGFTAFLDWTPSSAQVGTHAVEIRVTDPSGAEARQSFVLQVVVEATNRPPTFVNTPRLRTHLDGIYASVVRAQDPDGDALSFSLVSSPAGMQLATGAAAPDGSTLVSWQPDSTQLGSHLVQLRVTDGRGGSADLRFSVQVGTDLLNQPPVIVSRPVTGAAVGELYAYDLQAVDPESDPLLWTVVSGPTGLSLDPILGTLRWMPRSDQVGQPTVVVEVRDSYGEIDRQEFRLDVLWANRPPQITSTPLPEAQLGVPYVYLPRATDPDGDPLTWRSGGLSLPAGLAIDVRTGAVTWTPTTAQVGSYALELVVSDGRGGEAVQRFTLHAFNFSANRSPVIVSNPLRGAGVGRPYTYLVQATDADAELISIEPLRLPPGATLTVLSAVLGRTEARLAWTPAAAGLETVVLVARDPARAAGMQQFTLAARPNSAPQWASAPQSNAVPGLVFTDVLQAVDAEGDRLWFAVQGPAGMSVDSLGRLRWLPPVGTTGTLPVTRVVTDDYGASTTQTYSLRVAADVEPPAVALQIAHNLTDSQGARFIRVGTEVAVRVDATDNVGVAERGLTVSGFPAVLSPEGLALVEFPVSEDVDLVATAVDASGNRTSVTNRVSVVDPDALGTVQVVIHSPTNSAILTRPVSLIASVTSTVALRNFVVEVAPLDGDFPSAELSSSDPRLRFRVLTNGVFAAGTLGISNATLGRFDPTRLINGGYLIRLSVFDRNGQGRQEAAQVSVAGNLKFGELAVEYVDLEVPLAGIPITITRAYDSRQADRQGDFGHGWSLAVQDGQVLETGKKAFVGLSGQGSTFTVKTRVYLTAPDGRRLGFTFQPQFASSALVFGAFYRPAFVSDPGVLDRLEPLEAPAAYQVRSDGSVTAGFGLVGYDPSGYRLRTRDGLVYEYDQALGLKRVQDTAGNRVEYRPEGVFHYAAGATQPDESIAFVRDAAGRIAEIVDPAGKRLRYEYDAVGDLRRFTDQVNNTVRFDYHGLQPHFLTNVVDALGNAILRAEFDANGVLLAVRDGAGNPIRQQFDSDSLTGVLTDGNGHTTRSVYDDRGNEVRRVDALGGVTEFEYDANDNEVLQRDARGVVTRKSYDSKGNLTTVVDGLGNTTRLTYGPLGRATSITGPGGATVAFELDPKGRVAGVAHALGAVARRGYDAQGRLTSVGDFNGHVEQLQYDNGCACGAPSRIVQPDGSTRTFEYNSLGGLVREVDELGNETTLTYDDAGRVLSSRDPDGQVLRFTYRGNLVASRTDAMGRTTSYGYDTSGRLTSLTNAAGGVVRFQFDGNGNRTQIQDPEGNVTTFRYDALNRVTEAIDPFGRAFTNRYDAVGNRIESIDRNGRRITMGYDAANRPTNEVWWDGVVKVKEILYRHDAEGQLVEARDGGIVEEFVFDPLSRLKQSTRRGVPGLPSFSLNYSYDAFTNILSIADSMGFRVDSTFDNRSRLHTRRWQGNGFSPVFARFDHDPAGRRTSVVRGLGLSGQQRVGESLYAYNRLSSTTNLTHRSAAGASVLGLRYRHNAAQEVLERSLGTEVSRFAYDAAGQLTNVFHTAQPAEVYRYDLAQNRVGDDLRVGRNNRITEFQDWVFGYDGEGNIVSRSNRVSGLTTRYVYDHRNRMTDVFDLDLRGAELRRTSFEYDLLNRRVTRRTGGQVNRSVHNLLDVWADLDAQGNVMARYGHGDRPDEHHVRWAANGTPVWALLDDQETVLGVSDSAGTLIAQRRYDSFGNILNPDESTSVGRFGFQGHEWDAETGLYYYRARYYDPVLGRFLQEDPLRQEGSLPNLYAFLNNSPPNYSDRFGLTAAIERGILSRIAIATARCVAKLGIDLAVDFAIEAVALDAASKVLGIYVYQRPDGKYYVGQSVDIRRRMAEHGNKVKRIVAVLQVTTKEASAANYLNNLEQALISALGGPNTKGNKNYGGILKNLREQLRAGNPKRLCWLFETRDGQLYWIEVEIDWRTEPDRVNRDVGGLG